MGLTITLSNLASRVARNKLTSSSGGKRVLGKGTTAFWTGVGKFFTGLGNAIGWALNNVLAPVLQVSYTTIWSWIVGGTRFILNYNWNETDQQIAARFEQAKLRLVEQLGESMGVTVGWLACGYIPGVTMLKFNKPMAIYVLENVSEEALDEIGSEFGLLAQQTSWTIINKFLADCYIGIRHLIKNAANGDSDTLAGGIVEAFFKKFPSLKESAKKWGEPGQKPWSISRAIEEKIEEIKNPYVQAFFEGFWDEVGDSCIEAGYVVAGAMDSFTAQQRLQKISQLGEEKLLVVKPDRQIEERMIFAGRAEIVKPHIMQAIGVTYPMLDGKDLGMWVGEPVTDHIIYQDWEFMIRIFWRGKKEPPFGKSKRAQCSIRGIKREKLDWENIKRLAGGKNGYMWGRYRLEAYTDNGRPTLYVAEPESGSDMLEKLITELTDNKVSFIDPKEEAKTGKRKTHKSLYKESTLVYPAEMVIFNKQKALNEADGRAEVSGVFKQRKYKIPLYTEKKPSNWDELIEEIFKTPGPDD